ncbi:MAG: alpha/beta fold hydrolase, partial [Streptosporangiaceae bacterium]|nr:alpha/beta fold hydrolase [Streptosporangiaceae bacterium]
MTIELNFGVALPALAGHHRVIAVELQGHGRTADVDRPPTFPDFAADVIALLDHLGIERADVAGFSIGGLTGYELVISYPERVRRAVVASADHRNDRGGEADPARLPTPDDFQAMRDAYVGPARRAAGHHAHGSHPRYPAGACDRGVPRLMQHGRI